MKITRVAILRDNPHPVIISSTSIIEVLDMPVEVKKMGKLGVIRVLYLTNGCRMVLRYLLHVSNPVHCNVYIGSEVSYGSCESIFNIRGNCLKVK